MSPPYPCVNYVLAIPLLCASQRAHHPKLIYRNDVLRLHATEREERKGAERKSCRTKWRLKKRESKIRGRIEEQSKCLAFKDFVSDTGFYHFFVFMYLSLFVTVICENAFLVVGEER